MDNETRNNARRLAGALWRHAEDPASVARCASALNYLPDQLKQDMANLLTYINELERETGGRVTCKS